MPALPAHVCVVSDGGAKREERTFRHGGAGLAEMAEWIAARSEGAAEDIPVAIEVPHGPVVESLMDRGFAVYSINPKQLDRFRDRFSPAGAKDDSRDARVLADALRTDLHCFRRIDPVDPAFVKLREWSRIAEELTRDRTRLANRVREQLWRYYPQILEATDSVAQAWFLELWARVPTPAKARRIRRKTPGTTEAAVAHIRSASERLRLVQRQLVEAKREIECLLESLDHGDDGAGQPGGQRDVTVLSSLPGVGQTVLATLLAEAPHALQRRDYQALRCLCGVAPVTRRSGKSMIVVRRLAAHPRHRGRRGPIGRRAAPLGGGPRSRRRRGRMPRPGYRRPDARATAPPRARDRRAAIGGDVQPTAGPGGPGRGGRAASPSTAAPCDPAFGGRNPEALGGPGGVAIGDPG